ncbi:uncharacterized protein EV420DRAFT_1557437 [Desarmillaria tabescens]|uniref:Uncharacterized protein n=1 Tax=Armillaria tabescens TaxID=1929756 RepID=A0AA39N0H9_ARMTA|nr:uncharacterized protein EV420DRAFT_1557437 [Desarmillaria tabescens]KAK0452899.1 hypothetical protein EV420DRAFT_1557437 [Desarmillaria tabescens]
MRCCLSLGPLMFSNHYLSEVSTMSPISSASTECLVDTNCISGHHQAGPMGDFILASTAQTATASGLRDSYIAFETQVCIARRHQAAVKGLIDSVWKESSIQLSPTELSKTKALVDQDAERCKSRLMLCRTQSMKGRKWRKDETDTPDKMFT